MVFGVLILYLQLSGEMDIFTPLKILMELTILFYGQWTSVAFVIQLWFQVAGAAAAGSLLEMQTLRTQAY